MIDFKNLIDMLPYYFKDNDTYKVDGKGILQRFLDICGDYFSNEIYEDTSKLLEITDLDKTPDMYLIYFWELLGQMPFAIGNHIDEEAWKTNFNGLLGDQELERISRSWVVPKSGPFSLPSEQVRRILKYSISLLKIRGSKAFFEIIFRMYGLNCELVDPTKSPDYNGWVSPDDTKPRFDRNVYFDNGHFDNSYQCTQCIPVEFLVTGHTFTDKYQSGFTSFRKGVENIINRFKPFNVSFRVNYGFEVKDNYTIQAAFVDPKVNSIVTGTINKVPIIVNLTSDWPDADLRYQVMYKSLENSKEDTWGYTRHENGSIYNATIPGIYYFRSLENPSMVTSIVVDRESGIPTYTITADPQVLVITPEVPNPSTLIRASAILGNVETSLSVRKKGTEEIKDSGQSWQFSEPGSYIFEIADYPNYTVTVLVSKQENVYSVVCNPESVQVDLENLSQAKTKLTISDLYKTENLQCYEQSNPSRIYNNGDTFTADSFKQYTFICTLDTTLSGNFGKFLVSQILTDYQYLLQGPGPLELNDLEEAYADLVLLVLPQNDNSDYIDNRVDIYWKDMLIDTITLKSVPDDTYSKFTYRFTCVNPGNYRAVCKGDPDVSVVWEVKPFVRPVEYNLYIEPVNIKETNPDGTSPWTPDYYNNNSGLPPSEKSLATYQLLNNDSVARFYLKSSFDMGENNTVVCTQTGETYTVNSGEAIELTDPGEYTFVSDWFLVSAKLIIKDFPLVVEIKLSKEIDTLTPNKDEVSTVVTCTSNHASFNTDIKLLGSDQLYTSPLEFTTNKAGEYTFMSANKSDVRVTYKVGIDFEVTPEELIWNPGDISQKVLTINTGGSQEWNIIQ